MAIDEYFVSKLNKNEPNILFIPTAIENLDPKHLYEAGFKRLYEQKLNCKVQSLYLSDFEKKENIRSFLDNFDAFYISGGDTQYMLDQWKKTKFDQLLIEYALKGKPIAGISAGAMCWFKYVLTEDGTGELALVDGLGLFPDMCVPHWNKFKNAFVKSPISEKMPFIAIDDCCAIEVTQDSIQLLHSREGSSSYYYSQKAVQKPGLKNFMINL